MAYCAPRQLSQCLPKIVPKLTEILMGKHPEVQSAGQTALQQCYWIPRNIFCLFHSSGGSYRSNEYTKYSLDVLLLQVFSSTCSGVIKYAAI
ncbi:protein ILITYHIA-like [Tripterygium wilfordii]|uniref:protein ILITYHIA-like n=1 Tax=Tripterygium wilfordii TaxID=458696 RepID=UPI0018F7EE2F|nr:protein ILITYHIA-like [Tripterygium wilfordii]